MSERVHQRTRAVAVELVLERPDRLAPAAMARLKRASTSSTYRRMLTGEPPSDCGPRMPMSGNSSASMRVESPILISAWPILPLGSARRDQSVAPNACL